jgi:hypothetical protein
MPSRVRVDGSGTAAVEELPTKRLFTIPASAEFTVKPGGRLKAGPLVGKLRVWPASRLAEPSPEELFPFMSPFLYTTPL